MNESINIDLSKLGKLYTDKSLKLKGKIKGITYIIEIGKNIFNSIQTEISIDHGDSFEIIYSKDNIRGGSPAQTISPAFLNIFKIPVPKKDEFGSGLDLQTIIDELYFKYGFNNLNEGVNFMENTIYEVKDTIIISQGDENIILEKGDKIKILSEEDVVYSCQKCGQSFNDYGNSTCPNCGSTIDVMAESIRPNYTWNHEMEYTLDKVVEMIVPNLSYQLKQAILNRDLDNYYELVDSVTESLKGSISKYWTPYGGFDNPRKSVKESKIKEEVDVKKVIKDLQGNFAGSNEEQMKSVQLLKGLATSDDPMSNEFMKALDKETTRISKEILGE